jgi:signal transduction histidine kinase
LCVEDNGQGTKRDLQNHIFKIYFRGTEYSQGNGLGLYVVHTAVEKLKGNIELESVPLEASRFKVFLPF